MSTENNIKDKLNKDESNIKKSDESHKTILLKE